MKENKEFALKVKSIRERQNMTIEELAEKGVTLENYYDNDNFITISLSLWGNTVCPYGAN